MGSEAVSLAIIQPYTVLQRSPMNDVSSGSLTVSLFDADGNLLQTSHPISGGLKVRERVSWPEEFTLGPWIASPVSLRFDLQGGAKLHAVRFDDLFWDGHQAEVAHANIDARNT